MSFKSGEKFLRQFFCSFKAMLDFQKNQMKETTENQNPNDSYGALGSTEKDVSIFLIIIISF